MQRSLGMWLGGLFALASAWACGARSLLALDNGGLEGAGEDAAAQVGPPEAASTASSGLPTTEPPAS